MVIGGGGHTNFACKAWLARSGLKVCFLTINPWIGGVCVTREVTKLGLKHDLFGSSHVCIHANPDFQDLLPDLNQHGLEYIRGAKPDHRTPKQDDPSIVIYKNIEKPATALHITLRLTPNATAKFMQIGVRYAMGVSRGCSLHRLSPDLCPAQYRSAIRGC